MIVMPNGTAKVGLCADVAQGTESLDGVDRIIFLDIDGVLNALGTKNRSEDGTRFVDPERVSILNRILKATDASIVLSSSWRKPRHRKGFNALVRKGGIDGWKKRFVGSTPMNVRLSDWRGAEIGAWLENNGYQGRYAIIDDDASGMAPFKKNFFKTNDIYGLTDEIADKVIQHLGAI